MKKNIMYVLLIVAMIAFYGGYNDGRSDKHKAKQKSKVKIENQSNTTNPKLMFVNNYNDFFR